MRQPYTILAQLRAMPGKRDSLRALLEDQVAPTRTEDGCLAYHLHSSEVDPDLFLIYENWRSVEDLERHQAMPHLAPLRERGEELLEGGLVVMTLTMLSPYDTPAA